MEEEKKNNRIGEWIRRTRPLSFMRELLVVILGIVITFGVSTCVSNRSRQDVLKQSMQTVVTELKRNREIIRDYHDHFKTEKRIYEWVLKVRSAGLDLETIPVDTLQKYRNLPHSSRNISLIDYGFSALQISNLIPYIKASDLTADLFECYGSLDQLQIRINNYASFKEEAIFDSLYQEESLEEFGAVGHWGNALSHNKLRNFILLSSPSYLEGVILRSSEAMHLIDRMVERIESEYGLVSSGDQS